VVAEVSDNETHGWRVAEKRQKIELKPKRVLKMCLGKREGKKRKADRVFTESRSDWIGWSKAQVSWINDVKLVLGTAVYRRTTGKAE
jgi:hypothetical protein